MNIYGEYTTVHDTREVYLSSQKSSDDALILSFIRQVSRDIDRIARRIFYPMYETRYFDAPKYNTYDLELNDELISLTSVTNGDGAALDITKLILYELNSPTKHKIRLLPTVSVWKNSSVTGTPDKAITVVGLWGNIYDRTAGWQWRFVLSAQISDSATSFTATPGIFFPGMIIKIDDEYMYVSAVSYASATATPPTTVDTLTVERAINGSVAVLHVISSLVYIWSAGHDITMLTAAASVGYYNLKSNPLASSFTIDGVSFQTPKDVSEFIRDRLAKLTVLRLGFA